MNYEGYYQQFQKSNGTVNYYLVTQDKNTDLSELPPFTYWWSHEEVLIAIDEEECIFNNI